jgi:hypothetical protein
LGIERETMTAGIISTLVKHRALEPKKTGPAHAMTPEEAHRVKLDQQTASRIRRRERMNEAEALGEPLPVFKAGRPRK